MDWLWALLVVTAANALAFTSLVLLTRILSGWQERKGSR